MTRMSARTQIEAILRRNFKYLFDKSIFDINAIHLVFQMDSKSYNLQMSLEFEEKWCDVLCFISPTVLTTTKHEAYWQALQTVNHINWNVKSWGRYYIDEYNDLVYSIRLNYNVLKSIPDECAKEIEKAVDYYADLFILLLKVCEGKENFEYAKYFIHEMWGVMQ